MAKPVKKKVPAKSGPKSEGTALYTNRNHWILGVGILTIIIGFYFLAQLPVNGFWTMYMAPIFLVIGFLVIIPLGIMVGYKETGNSKGD